MAIISKSMRRRGSMLVLVGLGSIMISLPTAAQAQADQRLDRIEAQLRAVQRAVFPGGSDRYFEPEVATGASASSPAPQVGMPAASALTDVLARLDAIESQLARLTASSEVNANALDLVDARVAALEGGAPPPALNTRPAPTQQIGVIPVPGTVSNQPVTTPATPTAPAVAPTAGPTPARLAAVQAIPKPATGDAGDDEYTYGFRLWEAKFYPEAQQQLALFVQNYPTHPKISYGRNLLGRAFLDAGDARRAATYFFENYQADKQSPRAPDSLLYLAESMVVLGDTSRACIALAEFGDTYAALATGRLQQQYDANRRRVNCS